MGVPHGLTSAFGKLGIGASPPTFEACARKGLSYRDIHNIFVDSMLCLVAQLLVANLSLFIWVQTTTQLCEVGLESISVVNVAELVKLGQVRVLPLVRFGSLELDLLSDRLLHLLVVLILDPLLLQLMFLLVSLVLQGHNLVELLVH